MKKPTRRELIDGLKNWYKLMNTGFIQADFDKVAKGLGYQSAFRDCCAETFNLVNTEMLANLTKHKKHETI